MLKTYLYLIFLILSLTFHCQVTKKDSSKNKVPIVFQVSDEHKSYFVDLDKNDYTEDEIMEVFRNRKDLARSVCEMIYGQKKFSKETISKLISAESLKKEPFKTWAHPVPKLIVGCWNFFKLNDVRPDRDFLLVSKLYESESKDCFTVGFMQAYLMHNSLGCKTLTMLDLDWKILEAHKQLIDIFHNEGFKTEEQIDTSLLKLKLGWIARFDNRPMEAETKTNLDSLCFSEHHSMCKKILLDFQKNILNLNLISLRLSALHNSNFKTNNNYTKIIYLSNAIDDIYTNNEQFEYMISQTALNFNPGQKAVFVHHAAGRSLFGIYELKKTESGQEIKTICKDKYLTTPVVDITKEYSTHFEKFSSNKNFPTCESLLK